MKTSCIVLSASFVFAAAGAALAQKGMSEMPMVTALAGPMGELAIVSTAGQQQIEVIVGPVSGEVRVQGVPTIPSDFVFTDIVSISVTTGNAQDFVAVRIYSEISPDVIINTAGGNSDVIVEYATPVTDTVVSNVIITGGAGNDKAAFLVSSAANSFTANWTVTHGNGQNEALASINSTNPTDAFAVNFNVTAGTGQDKAELFMIADAALVNMAFGGNLGSNNDTATYFVEGLSPATTNTTFNLNLGAGLDTFNSEVISRGGLTSTTGTASGGDGLDTLVFKLEGDGLVAPQFDGGNGADLIDFSLKGNQTGTPRLLGGNGNDELKIVLDGPRTLTPFIDGGPGFDKAIGFGTIVNVEQIN